jgi:hypothetical protein
MIKKGRNSNMTKRFEDIAENIKKSILESANELLDVLEEEEKRAKKLRFFTRNSLQRTYIKRTDLNIQEWIKTINDIINQFNNNEFIDFFNSRMRLLSLLEKLEKHFELVVIDSEKYKKLSDQHEKKIENMKRGRTSVNKLIAAIGE